MTESDSNKKSEIKTSTIVGAAGNPKGIISARAKIKKINCKTEEKSEK